MVLVDPLANAGRRFPAIPMRLSKFARRHPPRRPRTPQSFMTTCTKSTRRAAIRSCTMPGPNPAKSRLRGGCSTVTGERAVSDRRAASPAARHRGHLHGKRPGTGKLRRFIKARAHRADSWSSKVQDRRSVSIEEAMLGIYEVQAGGEAAAEAKLKARSRTSPTCVLRRSVVSHPAGSVR